MASKKGIRWQFFFWCFLIFNFVVAHSQIRNLDGFYSKEEKFYSVGLEYVSSFCSDKDIEVYSFRFGYGSFLLKNVSIQGTFDMSGTDGLLRIDSENPSELLNAESFGLGTSFLLRWYVVRFGSVALFLDVSAGILYTFQSFPPKGTKLNFTARPGGGIAIHLNKKLQLLAGLNRFHLSNGQGFKHPHNPAYDGLGVFMGLVFRVKQ
jgi:hypothetical protein